MRTDLEYHLCTLLSRRCTSGKRCGIRCRFAHEILAPQGNTRRKRGTSLFLDKKSFWGRLEDISNTRQILRPTLRGLYERLWKIKRADADSDEGYLLSWVCTVRVYNPTHRVRACMDWVNVCSLASMCT